jgi:hypothetical protein
MYCRAANRIRRGKNSEQNRSPAGRGPHCNDSTVEVTAATLYIEATSRYGVAQLHGTAKNESILAPSISLSICVAGRLQDNVREKFFGMVYNLIDLSL